MTERELNTVGWDSDEEMLKKSPAAPAPEIDVDGIDTPKGATLIGKATLNKELGKYVCLANVGGALCVVELNAPAAPAPGFIRLPTTVDEAELMAKTGMMWLEQNAPERLKPAAPAHERIWFCKIGGPVNQLPPGADGPMRDAVSEAFKRITGNEDAFCFSGWGGELTEGERAVVEDRPFGFRASWEEPIPAAPAPDTAAILKLVGAWGRVMYSPTGEASRAWDVLCAAIEQIVLDRDIKHAALRAQDSNVVLLSVSTTLDVPVERVLDSARDLESIVVLGYDKNGNEYFASSIADGSEVLWLVERFKRSLLDAGEDA